MLTTLLLTPVHKYFRIKPDQTKALKQLGIKNVYDLLYYFPKKYTQNSDAEAVINIENDSNEHVVFGQISNLKIGKTFKTHIPMASATLKDDSGTVK